MAKAIFFITNAVTTANKMPEIAYKVALGLSDKGYEEKVYSKYDAKAKSVFDACYKIHNFKKEL